MATAYGVSPVLSMPLPEVETPYPYLMRKTSKGKLVQRLDAEGLPITNPDYDAQLMEFAKALAPVYDELLGRQAFGKRAAHGFNITYELLRRARNLNFANEVYILLMI